MFLSEGRFDEAFDQSLPVVDRLVERRQADRAAALLQQIVQRNSSHVRSLAKLVEIYRLSRNDQLVAQTYSLMVEAYLAEGRQDQAASVLEMLVQLEPTTSSTARSSSGCGSSRRAAGGFDVDLAHAAPAPAPAPVPVPPAVARGIELSGPLSAEDQEFIGEHLAEGRVFRKYGLGDKARDQFEAVLSRFPDNTDALSELADLLAEKGESAAAAQRLRVLAEVLRLKGDAARAARVDEEANALAGPALPAPRARARSAAGRGCSCSRGAPPSWPCRRLPSRRRRRSRLRRRRPWPRSSPLPSSLLPRCLRHRRRPRRRAAARPWRTPASRSTSTSRTPRARRETISTSTSTRWPRPRTSTPSASTRASLVPPAARSADSSSTRSRPWPGARPAST